MLDVLTIRACLCLISNLLTVHPLKSSGMKLQQTASPICKDIMPRFLPCTWRRGTLCGHCSFLLGREDTSSSSCALKTWCSDGLVESFLLMKGKIQLRSDVMKQRCLAGTWHNLVLPKPAVSLQSPAKASIFQNIFSPFWRKALLQLHLQAWYLLGEGCSSNYSVWEQEGYP